ncbi:MULTISPECIES: type II toxin-antitoxin system RelE family toxin [unclassified Streptomyces]|uniref:type II toxin-antitoxin system RelE family toxin n=1 Tax=unclassified Streptomyces TaxID=2593676 RepID=UPI0022B6FB6D|nr:MULTISPECIES: type II toxin-antitoxin system RelE/ParE family toxin [unclassified Streptomyces]MCZ7414909.1 type II toxin-antitoxin system RelE/ParE family toxin [Streptomyces sp. WMMC897]MCZ7431852.1 type II toxin-antitoxin system RelE/ParE family toxin [Streptomyces sp. WMMC1477]
MKYAFRWLPRARRQLRAIDRTSAMRILQALTALGDDPYQCDGDVKKLSGEHEIYRLRVGNFRIAYRIDDGELIILVVAVGNRRDVYRNLRD